jgi:hypothetical protein
VVAETAWHNNAGRQIWQMIFQGWDRKEGDKLHIQGSQEISAFEIAASQKSFSKRSD